MRIALLVLLAGCYEHHVVDGERPDARIDARIDDAGACGPNDRFVTAAIRGRGCPTLMPTATDGWHFFDAELLVVTDELVFEATSFDMSRTRCRVEVRGLSEAASAGLAERLNRIADGFVQMGGSSITVRDTSLCDGPPPYECPLAFHAESGPLRLMPTELGIGVRWGDATCTGACGQVRELVFEQEFGGRFDVVRVAQGEVGEGAMWSYANVSSWNTCTDEPDTITWAAWMRR